MLRDILTNHKMPVAVSVLGLILAFGLAVAPSFSSSGSEVAAQSAALDDAVRSTTERDLALQVQQDALAAQVSALQERVRVHDLAISRTFSRVVAIRADVAAMSDALKDADTNGVHIATLNRAVTRLNLKINDLSAAIEP